MRLHNTSTDLDYYTVEDMDNIISEIILNNGIKWRHSKRSKLLDISIAFDIEATSFKDVDDKRAIMYVWQLGIQDDSTGVMYPIIGRTWDEFKECITSIKEGFKVAEKNTEYYKVNGRRVRSDLKKKYLKEHDNDPAGLPEYIEEEYRKWKETSRGYYIPIYIHNMGYEFSYLRWVFRDEWSDLFAVKSQAPLYGRIDGIEFRCSYLLSGCALKDLPTKIYKKKEGDLDYDLVRHYNTPLTDEEIGYCINDVTTLCEYISQKRAQDGDITKMEYTKTGYVRSGLKHHCMGKGASKEDYYKKLDYLKIIKPLKFHSTKEYIVQRSAYMGGHTAASTWYSGQVVYNVSCLDFTSSYPAVICSDTRFPTYLHEYKETLTEDEYKSYVDKGYAIVCLMSFDNIDSVRIYDSPIPSSKIVGYSKRKDLELNNGKLVRCKNNIEIFATNLDYEVYSEFYKWDKATFSQVYIYATGRLPKSLIEYTLTLYAKKTTLKGVKGQTEEGDAETLYSLYKELLNSIYGCMVQDPCKMSPECDIDTGAWSQPVQYNSEFLDDKVDAYNRKIDQGGIASVYIWGVFVTAIARWNLFTGLIEAGDAGNWVYCDTDSLYVKNVEDLKDYIDWYNDRIQSMLEETCEAYNLDKEMINPKDIKGKRHPLGAWDPDGDYKLYKVLGAKRYITLDNSNHFKITVAGLGKNQGAKYLAETYGKGVTIERKNGKDVITVEDASEIFNNFTDNLRIPGESTGKQTHTILTEKATGSVTDYLGNTAVYYTEGGTYMEPAPFSLNIQDAYLEFILGVQEELRYA